MRIEFWIDPELSDPHIRKHAVQDYEVEEVLAAPGIEWGVGDGVRNAIGQTDAGRFLQVVFRQNEDGSIFVITAYPPKPGALKAYKRNIRKKR